MISFFFYVPKITEGNWCLVLFVTEAVYNTVMSSLLVCNKGYQLSVFPGCSVSDSTINIIYVVRMAWGSKFNI